MPGMTDAVAAANRERALARTRSRWNMVPWVLILAILAVLSLQGAEELQQVLQPPSPDWSRPLVLDTVSNNHSLTQVVLPDGRLLAFWAQDKGIRSYLVGTAGSLEATHDLLPEQTAPNSIQALEVGGQVQLFWLDYPTHTLFTATVSDNGATASPASVVATGISAFAAAPGGQPLAPRVFVLAGEGARFLAPATTGHGWQLLAAPAGFAASNAVSLQGAQDGTLYGVLAQPKQVRNGAGVGFSLLRLTPTGDLAVTALAERPLEEMKDAISTVSLGLDDQNGYLFWDVSRNDRGTRSTQAQFVTWPLSQPPAAPLEPKSFAFDPSSTPAASGPSGVTPAPGQAPQLMVAVPATAGSGRDRAIETFEVMFQDGKLVAQHLAGPASSLTMQPQPAQVGRGRWLTWIVPVGTGVTLHVGSTLPSFRAAQEAVSAQDWEDAIGTTLVNTGYAYLALVVSLLWLLPTVMAIVLAYLVSLNWAERNPFWLNLGGLAVYALAKLYVARLMLFKPVNVAVMPAWLGHHPTLVILATIALAVLESFRRNRRWLGSSVAAGVLPTALYDVILMALLLGPYTH
ncbi:MAG: hypothetical protein ACYC5Y_05660 [Symbiobacteriia bacterium]